MVGNKRRTVCMYTSIIQVQSWYDCRVSRRGPRGRIVSCDHKSCRALSAVTGLIDAQYTVSEMQLLLWYLEGHKTALRRVYSECSGDNPWADKCAVLLPLHPSTQAIVLAAMESWLFTLETAAQHRSGPVIDGGVVSGDVWSHQAGDRSARVHLSEYRAWQLSWLNH